MPRRRPLHTRALLALVTFPVLVLGACSEESGLSEEEQEFADAFAASIEDDEDGFGAEPEDAQCMGDAVMEELGVEPFEEADVTPDDIGGEDAGSPGEVLGDEVVTDEQADSILDGWQDCVGDLSEFMATSASGTEEFDLDEDGEACLAEGLEEDGLARDILRASFTSSEEVPDQDAFTAFFVVINDCARDDDGVGLFERQLAENIAGDGSATPEQAECIVAAIVEDMGEEAFLAFLSAVDQEESEGAEAFQQAYLVAAEGCGVPLEG
jgi:hypothetical protein